MLSQSLESDSHEISFQKIKQRIIVSWFKLQQNQMSSVCNPRNRIFGSTFMVADGQFYKYLKNESQCKTYPSFVDCMASRSHLIKVQENWSRDLLISIMLYFQLPKILSYAIFKCNVMIHY